MIVLLSALLSVGLHLALGWEWTLLAGGVAGAWRGGRSLPAGLAGAAGTALGWAAVVIYTAAVAPTSLRILADTMSAFAGNIPGEALVGTTVLLGGVLGALGGAIGALLRSLLFGLLFATD
jgi:hypothetical protein